ncbi:MAG: hypothetical protein N3G22_03620 [Candidatus Micrarchaeota archaeon]|nr:hypothetical protein [Candidatus Micrarchaeota archaeon]
MSFLKHAVAFAIMVSVCFGAFSIQPYLYSGEKESDASYVSFQTANNTTLKVVKIKGEAAMLLLEDQLVLEKERISALLSEYYKAKFYPTQEELDEIKNYADLFNKSRNYPTKYGPAEKVCYGAGTFLAYKPCSDYNSCFLTASMVCSVTQASGCAPDLLAPHIYEYKKAIDKLNEGYSKFSSAYSGLSSSSPSLKQLLEEMEAGFDMMKAGADEVSKSKLRFPDDVSTCPDCIGVCPDPKFDYNSINSAKEKIAKLKEKSATYLNLEKDAEKIAISTSERVKYKEGEEKAVMFRPSYQGALERFEGLKAKAIEAKALVSDADFVSAADSFLSKEELLQQKFEKRDFEGFESLLSSYETAGRTLSAMIEDATEPYQKAIEAQDECVDQIIRAQWNVNRLSKSSVDAYASLVERQEEIDSKFNPPMTAQQYGELAKSYQQLGMDAKAFSEAAKNNLEGSVFLLGNAISRTSVDGAMALASSIVPISFKTRQSVAKYVPPLVLLGIDTAIIAIGLLGFVAAFYYFHGFFKNKLLISGWVLSMLFFVLLVLAGSAAFYVVALSSERHSNFGDFITYVDASGEAALIVEYGDAPPSAREAMGECADQVAEQLSSKGKRVSSYYIDGEGCEAIVPVPAANNSTNKTYQRISGKSAAECLNSIPDIPIFDLQYSESGEPPVFTTVVTKQAIIKGNAEYYGKKPMCDPANVLG